MNLEHKTLSNRYEILEEVGIGGMATVYKAKCKLLNRFVAVKVLKDEFAKDAEFVKRFRAEAQSAASLTHPNIVSVYDVGEEDGINYIVMEYLEGDTLKDAIDKNGKLSNELTLKYASQIASALEAAHSAKIIHRDIKPQNIVLSNNNTSTIAKVTDFGIAKMSSKDTITSSASTIGSVHYFSPEHAKGCFTDEKSDIYSLGVVMYEMATGELPFNADTPVTVALKHIQEEPTEPKELVPSISNRLNSIIMKAMKKNTSERYQSATELLDDIFAAINSKEEDYDMSKKASRMGNTQVVPIIGLKDDIKPSVGDEIASEIIGSRKSARMGKKLSEMEAENNEKKVINSLNEDKTKKKKKRNRIILLSIIAVVVIALGILVVTLVNTIIENSKTKLPLETAPKLVGEKYEIVKAKYESLGFSVLVNKYEINNEVEEGYIISQSVKEGEKLTEASIEVVVSKGAKKVEMIDVVGKDYTVAKYELESIGLKPEFKFVKNEEKAKNLILSQDIKKGEMVIVGSVINIEVSEGDGKIRVIVPSVVGESSSNAKKTLEDLKLKVVVKYVNDNSKADGVVTEQSVKVNSEVVQGTEIELTVNRTEKTKSVNITLSTYNIDETKESVSVKVTAKVEGVTNTLHNRTHTKTETGFEDFTVDVNGFTTAEITIYIDGEVVEETSITF